MRINDSHLFDIMQNINWMETEISDILRLLSDVNSNNLNCYMYLDYFDTVFNQESNL
jgi:hypothetical protein